jgi:glycosyltransferase involved in cell wall biosynthesis
MRVDATDKPGGDVIQVRHYIAEGRRAGKHGAAQFEGVLLDDLRADLSGFDLVHLTNIDRPVDTWTSFLLARAAGKPIVLSTIHHSYEEIERFERHGRGGLVGGFSGRLGFRRLEFLRSALRSVRYPALAWPTASMMRGGMLAAQRSLLAGADRILVLTEKEKQDLVRDFGSIAEEKVRCVRNGIAISPDALDGNTPREIDVCMVGRIEPRKNQIAVLCALERLGVSGVFIGGENPNHRGYCRQFQEMLAGSGSRWLGAIPHEETLRYLRSARVHVSASWFEVASLVDLEACAAGCGIVSSRCGGTAEVLGERAEYVDPGSEASIQEGICKMLERSAGENPIAAVQPATAHLHESWSEIGERLAGVYRECVRANSASVSRRGGETQ